MQDNTDLYIDALEAFKCKLMDDLGVDLSPKPSHSLVKRIELVHIYSEKFKSIQSTIDKLHAGDEGG